MGEMRFSSMCLMLKSVQELYNELCEKLPLHGEQEHMDNITPNVLDFFISFLDPFYMAQRELEGDK